MLHSSLSVPNTPPSVQVVENTNLQVPCSLVGNSSVVITSVYWTDPQGSVVSNNSTLQVLGIQRNRSGVYTCTIQTTSSNSISSTTVTVLCTSIAQSCTYIMILLFLTTPQTFLLFSRLENKQYTYVKDCQSHSAIPLLVCPFQMLHGVGPQGNRYNPTLSSL